MNYVPSQDHIFSKQGGIRRVWKPHNHAEKCQNHHNSQNLPKLAAKITQDHITANLTHLSFSVHLLLYHQLQFKSCKLVQTEILLQ